MLPDAKVTIKDGALNKIDNAPLKTEHPKQIKIPIIDTTKGFIPLFIRSAIVHIASPTIRPTEISK